MNNFYMATTKIFGKDVYTGYEYNIFIGEILDVKEVHKKTIVVTSNALVNEKKNNIYLEVDKIIFLESVEKISDKVKKTN